MPRSNLAQPLKELINPNAPELIWGIVEKYLYINKMDEEMIAFKLHCSDGTIRNRRANPRKLSLEEITMLVNALGIPPREVVEVLLGKRIIEME